MKQFFMRNEKGLTAAILCSLIVLLSLVPGQRVYADSMLGAAAEDSGYFSVLYNRDNGLPTSEANDIVQSEDGFIWIASYGGLVRYDGNTFYRYDPSTGIAGMTCLFVDSKDRIWGGSNDRGVFMIEKDQVTHFTKEDGLSDSFIHSICEDEAGNILIGSSLGLDYIDPELQIHMIEDERMQGEYIFNLERETDGEISGCTNSGAIFRVRDLKITIYYTAEEMGISGGIESWCKDPDNPDLVYIGSGNSMLYHGRLGEDARWQVISTGTLRRANHLKYFDGKLWICADNGIGYLENRKTVVLDDVAMSGPVYNVIQDYQGNLWFTSTRQGVMKLVHNQFMNISARAELPELVVNSTCLLGNDLYLGTDSGLYIVNSWYGQKQTELTEYMEGCRIRCIRQDSKGILWMTTRSEKGLVSYDPATGTIKSYNPANGNLGTDNTRVIMERKDGSFAVATGAGVEILSDGRVTEVYDQEDGIDNPLILCLEETDDGTLLMGSDGGGIYAERGGKIRNIGIADGLESEVILRIQKDPDDPELFWIITSSSMAYMKDWKVTTLHHFPYTNNFDLFFSQKNEDGNRMAWVLGSNGIYVVRRDDMLRDGQGMTYSFLDTKCGLPCTATVNSYSCLTDEGRLYIAGNQGVSLVDINKEQEEHMPLRIAVPSLLADDVSVWPENNVFTIPSNCKRLTIPAYIFTYSLENPHITYRLEGFDAEPFHTTRDQFSSVSYTNLPGGTYWFRLSAIDTVTGLEDESIVVTIVKEKAVYEYVEFWIVAVGGGAALLAAILLLYIRRKDRIHMEKQRAHAEQELAASIQTGALPAVFPAFPDREEFDIFALMDPAREVGGDFYDFFLIDRHHLALVIADVSDKGVPAAMFMMKIKTLIQNRTQFLRDLSPATVLTDINNQICSGNEAEMFVTVWMAILDLRTGEGKAANAGHEHPAFRKAGEKFELKEYRHSPSLGVMEDIPIREHSFQMDPGDILFVYTDGVPESTNSAKEFFGTDRMLQALNRDGAEDPKAITETVRAEMRKFSEGAAQFDDITMLCFRYIGTEESSIVRVDNETVEMTIPAERDRLDQVREFVDDELEMAGCPEREKNQLLLAVEELFVNIASYAYGEENGTARIRIHTSKDPFQVSVTLIDRGRPFDPLRAKDPNLKLSVEERPIGGLGIYMVRKMMDSVNYEYRDGENIIEIEKSMMPEAKA